MQNVRRAVAAIAGGALVAAPMTVLSASPANADGKEREFRVAGAEVDFKVEKDDGRFEVEVDIDDARPGSKYRIVLRHDGKRFFNGVRKADRDGDIEIERNRKNTKGKDVFKVVVKKVGGPKKSRVIRMR
ncbi:hypothetical protein [Nocardioides sp. TF02-7]|uniref:hypothetical protein n=1 Tax=Nocardioides sp. TF02-7 TaxID=2917724 RepID=UPI001F050F12|nr:hypothetical protein [Nocardioides sp. TF02-7]UMG91080.1 hypothetical protein MF408_12785 [Nocardioides sp. TF02-7]